MHRGQHRRGRRLVGASRRRTRHGRTGGRAEEVRDCRAGIGRGRGGRRCPRRGLFKGQRRGLVGRADHVGGSGVLKLLGRHIRRGSVSRLGKGLRGARVLDVEYGMTTPATPKSRRLRRRALLRRHVLITLERKRSGSRLVVQARTQTARTPQHRGATSADEARGRLVDDGGLGLVGVLAPRDATVVRPGFLSTTGRVALLAGAGDSVGGHAHRLANTQGEVGDGEAAHHDAGKGHAHEDYHADDLPHKREQRPCHGRPHVAATCGGHRRVKHDVGGLGRTRREDGEHRERRDHHEREAEGHASHKRVVAGQEHRDAKEHEGHRDEDGPLPEAQAKPLRHRVRHDSGAGCDE